MSEKCQYCGKLVEDTKALGSHIHYVHANTRTIRINAGTYASLSGLAEKSGLTMAEALETLLKHRNVDVVTHEQIRKDAEAGMPYNELAKKYKLNIRDLAKVIKGEESQSPPPDKARWLIIGVKLSS